MRLRARRHTARTPRVSPFPRGHNQGAPDICPAPDSDTPPARPAGGEPELRASLFTRELNEWPTLDLLRLHLNLSVILPRTREDGDKEAQSACLRMLARVEHELEVREL